MAKKNTGIVLSMAIILLVFLLVAFLLFAERLGIVVRDVEYEDPFLDDNQVITKEESLESEEKNCLVITDLGREDSGDAYNKCFKAVLLDMKIPTEVIDLGSMSIPEDLSKYDTIFLATPDVSAFSDRLMDILAWVEAGGRMMISMCISTDSYGTLLLQKAGVSYSGDFTFVDKIIFDEDFAIGTEDIYGVSDPFESSLGVVLRDTTKVYAWANKKDGLPIIWTNDYGKGRFVVCNVGIYEKSNRGVYSLSYTLLEDVGMYPVLNGGIIFLDDMPSPVPEGESVYIERDYNTTIEDFYVNIWFPDILKLSEKYKLPLVGLCIENYGKDIDGTTDRQKDTSRFLFFGNQILRSGGEIGYHGYNHQPLCLDNVDYKDMFDYHTWNSVTSIEKSFKELMDYTEMLYPDAEISCYVPPSNIMAEDGRKYIGSLYPAVRTISGSYFPLDDFSEIYETEFEVCEDGIVNIPRVTSGSIFNEYFAMAAFSELNFHYVFSHFIHPDDALDVDRGAELGWEQLYKNLDEFFEDIFDAAPNIRRVNTTTLAATVQRWAALTIDKEYEYSDTETKLKITLGNYHDEAYLFIRFNEGVPDEVTGGTIEKLTNTLYLLTAESSEIILSWKR